MTGTRLDREPCTAVFRWGFWLRIAAGTAIDRMHQLGIR